MGIEAKERLMARFELYGAIEDGVADVKAGRTKPLKLAMVEIRNRRGRMRKPENYHKEESL